jgi:hypothetical protein
LLLRIKSLDCEHSDVSVLREYPRKGADQLQSNESCRQCALPGFGLAVPLEQGDQKTRHYGNSKNNPLSVSIFF